MCELVEVARVVEAVRAVGLLGAIEVEWLGRLVALRLVRVFGRLKKCLQCLGCWR